MKNLLIYGSVILLGLTSCKTKSKTTTTVNETKKDQVSVPESTPKSDTQPTVYNEVTDKSCAVEVAFGSYASGIDGAAFDKVMALINENKVAHTSKIIGREGERRLCLPLTELNASQKNDFIERLKKIAAVAQLVSVSIR